jgi:hypothetical protein
MYIPNFAEQPVFYRPLDLMFQRQVTPLPQEYAVIFLLPSLVFAERYLAGFGRSWLVLYLETLLIIFLTHTGAALLLFFPTLALVLLAALNRQVGRLVSLLKGGFLAVLLGNIWMLGFLFYPLPKLIGQAAPVVDALLKTEDSGSSPINGFETVNYMTFPPVMGILLALAALTVGLVFCFYRKPRRCLASSIALGFISLSVLLYAPNLGLMEIVGWGRVVLPLFLFGSSMIGYFAYLALFSPIRRLFSKAVAGGVSFAITAGAIFGLPWFFPPSHEALSLEAVEYDSFLKNALRIRRDYAPLTWTIVSYVPQYPQVLGRGFHINTQDFLEAVSPEGSKVPLSTPKTFIFLEKRFHKFEGVGEWYYQYRPDVQRALQEWIVRYRATYGDMSLWYEDQNVLIYLIDRG